MPVDEATVGHFGQMFAVNAEVAFLAVQQALPYL